uniref:KIND domain-containing protein n=1 Tax=Equus asinus TaxID=9793 RepID=A0A9L0IST3_EQUAS
MARPGGSSGAAAAAERAGGAGRPEPWELSLEEVLKAYEQPINEEQAWAVCFQGCRGLRGAPGGRRRIRDTADILLRRDGSVGARREPGAAGEAGAGVWPGAWGGVVGSAGGWAKALSPGKGAATPLCPPLCPSSAS